MKRFIRFLSNYLLNNLDTIAITALIAIILKGIFFPLGERVPCKDSILTYREIPNTPATCTQNRVQTLLNAVHQHEGTDVQLSVASETLKMQSRLLFITLFAALITLLYSIKEQRPRQVIGLTALLIGLFWYGISVHKLDIENRGLPVTDIVTNTELDLLNIPPYDNRTYYLDFTKLQKMLEQGKIDHQKRKIIRFITPDISDMVFNLAPLLVLVIVYKLKKQPHGAA